MALRWTADDLRTLPLFAGLSDEQCARIHELGRLHEPAPGTTLVREGDHADRVFVVISGTARVEVDGTVLGSPVGPGDCVGELAVLDDAPRAATVVAGEPMVLLAFGAGTFRDLLDELPDLRVEVTRALTRRLRHASAGWAQLAVDTNVLLDAYFELQGTVDDQDRRRAIQEAANLLRRMAASAPAGRAASLDRLTPAERRVADLVAHGLSNAAVAAELFLSEHTVASHLKHIYAKLDVPSRVALAGAVLRPA